MNVFLLCLFAMMLYRCKLAPVNTYHIDYLSHKNTVLINGVFVILVYLSHSSAKCALTNSMDQFYILFKQHLLQLVVVTFLFYSGYGMCVSLMNKKGYADSLMKIRLPKLFVHFNIAILLYLIVQFFLGKVYKLPYILKAMIGWSSVGNSNWYIFVMLLLYVLLWISCKIFKKPQHAIHLTTLLTILYIVFMIKKGMPTRFYNTILCFNLGMYYALCKSRIEKIVMKNDIHYLMTLFISLGLYKLFFNLKTEHIVYYILWTFIFMVIVLLISMKFSMNSPILKWFGTNIFGVYILQRIPINILCALGFQKQSYLFIVVCLVITTVMTLVFNQCLKKVDQVLFSRKKA